MYKCLSCGESISFDQLNERIRCPFCGYRVLAKERTKNVVKVPAK